MSKTNDKNVLHVTYCCIMEHNNVLYATYCCIVDHNNSEIVVDILFHATMHIPSTVLNVYIITQEMYIHT